MDHPQPTLTYFFNSSLLPPCRKNGALEKSLLCTKMKPVTENSQCVDLQSSLTSPQIFRPLTASVGLSISQQVSKSNLGFTVNSRDR